VPGWEGDVDMRARPILFAIIALGTAHAALAQKLTPQDHIDIQQLNARYTFLIDECVNGGYDYADLYTPDGTFGVSTKWGDPGKTVARGRDALANAAGGGPGGCRKPRFGPGGRHVITSIVIEPRPGGAWGKAALLQMNIGGDHTANEPQGGYEDFYVKSRKGWRIKSRVHVFPGLDNSLLMTRMRELDAQDHAAASTPPPH
jgi:hypothetical protein